MAHVMVTVPRRQTARAMMLAHAMKTAPRVTMYRQEDSPRRVGDLGPDDFFKRVVIRSKDLAGTIYGTLLDAHSHPTVLGHTLIQMHGKKELILPDDMEAVVLE